MRGQVIVLFALTLALLAGSALVGPVAAKKRSVRPPIDRPVILPPQDPETQLCDLAEMVLNGYLPVTKTVSSSQVHKTKLTIKDGNVLDCDIAAGHFEIRFPITVKQYNFVPGFGWKGVGSASGTVRISFTVVSVSPSKITLSHLEVLAVNINNVPNWFDSGVVKQVLNANIPNSLSIAL